MALEKQLDRLTSPTRGNQTTRNEMVVPKTTYIMTKSGCLGTTILFLVVWFPSKP